MTRMAKAVKRTNTQDQETSHLYKCKEMRPLSEKYIFERRYARQKKIIWIGRDEPVVFYLSKDEWSAYRQLVQDSVLGSKGSYCASDNTCL